MQKIFHLLTFNSHIFFIYLFAITALTRTKSKLRYIKSRWGGKLLVVGKYRFSSNRKRKDTIYWRCTFGTARKQTPCCVRCRTKNGILVKIIGAHNHEPPPQIETILKKRAIKKNSVNDH